MRITGYVLAGLGAALFLATAAVVEQGGTDGAFGGGIGMMMVLVGGALVALAHWRAKRR